jgi:DNA-binding Lrp family transcriptional regulator
MMKPLTPVARAFINQFQGGFPIVERPFHSVAAKLGAQEAALIHTVRQLLDNGLLSRFGPLYDPAGLGGAVTLAALSAPEASFQQVADQVNRLPAVAHNYRRDHRLNMWFVVASDHPQGVGECLADIERDTGLTVYDFPKLREFYLGLWLELDEADRVTTVPVPQQQAVGRQSLLPLTYQRIVAATQGGFPVTPEPYAEIGGELGLDPVSVIRALQQMLRDGVIRRIGAVPNHYLLGLRGNGMTVWDIPDERVVELGMRIGRMDFVSHCYQRPRHPEIWRHNLFAMVHGQDRQEVLEKTARLRAVLGDDVRDYDVLFSSAVLKKTGLRLAA